MQTLYNYIKPANPSKLQTEILAAGLPLAFLTMDGTQLLNIYMSVELSSPQKDTLDAVVQAHNAVDLVATVASRVISAMDFGRTLMATIAAQNVLAGYDIPTIQDIMNRTARVSNALVSGSLYVAIFELNAVTTDSTIVTTAKITAARNTIQDYLGIPRT